MLDRIQAGRRRVLGIRRQTPELDDTRHFPVVRRSAAGERARHQRRRGRVAGHHPARRFFQHLVRLHLQVLGDLVHHEVAPVDVIGIGKNRAEAGRLDLLPGCEASIPAEVDGVQSPIFRLHPVLKPSRRVAAETELRRVQEPHRGPVDDVRLAPEVPAVKRTVASRLPRQRREEIQDALPHLRVIEAEAGRSLRLHYIAAVGDEFAVRIPHADPVGSRIDVDLDDCPQAGFIRQLEHLAELPQIILIGGWLGRGPVHPGLHGVEPKVLDLFQILPPDLTVPLGIGLEHRRTSLAAAIPHSERKEGILTLAARLFFREIGGRSRRGYGERQEQGEGADNTEPQGGWSEHDTSPAK